MEVGGRYKELQPVPGTSTGYLGTDVPVPYLEFEIWNNGFHQTYKYQRFGAQHARPSTAHTTKDEVPSRRGIELAEGRLRRLCKDLACIVVYKKGSMGPVPTELIVSSKLHIAPYTTFYLTSEGSQFTTR